MHFHIMIGYTILGVWDIGCFKYGTELFSIFCISDLIRMSTYNFNTKITEALSHLKRCLPTKLYNHTIRLLNMTDTEHIFESDGFEV